MLGASGLAGMGASLAPPLACSGACVISSSTTQGYSPPLLILTAGSLVQWISTEGGHESVGGGCLQGDFGYNVQQASPNVRFDIAGGQLFATVLDVDHGAPVACNGPKLPDGSFSLSYSCPFHSNMNGHVLVR